MKRLSIILIIIATLIISAIALISSNSRAKEAEIQERITRFYQSKYQYVENVFDRSKNDEKEQLKADLMGNWKRVIQNRESVIPYLLSFKNDTGKTLYGPDYALYKGQECLSPNNMHALYLIEAIIRGDFLFNRRGRVNLKLNRYFDRDCWNQIYLTGSTESLRDYSQVWALYEEWSTNEDSLKHSYTSPLSGSDYFWMGTSPIFTENTDWGPHGWAPKNRAKNGHERRAKRDFYLRDTTLQQGN